MWVVKIGGSVSDDPLFPQWLELLAQLGGGRVTLVCGGGGFADEVRRAQARWRFAELPAHNMAVLAMAQTAYLAQALQPRLQFAQGHEQIRAVLHAGRTALWMPLDWLREEPSAQTSWEMTSDSLALDLARRLNAERLVVVKSCPVDPAASLAELGARGVVDGFFAAIARDAGFPIDVVHRGELTRMRAMLLGAERVVGA